MLLQRCRVPKLHKILFFVQIVVAFVTTTFLCLPTWASLAEADLVDLQKGAYACAVIYGYTSTRAEDGELRDKLKAKFKYWVTITRVVSESENVKDALITGIDSFEKSVRSKELSKDEIIDTVEKCEALQKKLPKLENARK